MTASKKFCCCIPVRFGVFVISLIYLVLSALVVLGSILILTGKESSTADGGLTTTKSVLIVNAVYYGLVAILSLVGFIGAIGRKRGFVAFYGKFLWGAFGLHLVLAGYTIFRILHDYNPADDQICSSKGNDDNDKSDCISNGASKAVWIISQVLGTLLFLYGAIIVNRYKDQLDADNSAWHQNSSYTKEAFFTGAPAPEAHPLTQPYNAAPYADNLPYQAVPAGDYPYAAPPHSHGRNGSVV